jgi:hypothetical protein
MSFSTKIAGVWKTGTSLGVNISGAWKEVQNGYVNISGVWKKFYSASVPFVADVYVDEDLTTGLNDGTSWADAYNSWAEMVTGEARTLTSDLSIGIRSNGTVDTVRTLYNSAWDTNGFTLTIQGDTNNIPVLMTTGLTPLYPYYVHNVIIRNIIFIGYANYNFYSSGCEALVIINCIFVGSPTTLMHVESGLKMYNSILINNTATGYGINVSPTYTSEFYNCYCFLADGSKLGYPSEPLLTLTNCASSDLTGLAGLQNIPYTTGTFLNVTSGSEDLHLAVGSALIDAGVDESAVFTTDIEGTTRTLPWDIGAYDY